MNKMVILGLVAVATMTACGGGFGGDSPTLSGKILNWPAGGTGKVRVDASTNPVVSGSAVAVDTSGNFAGLAFPSASALAPALQPTTNGPCAAATVTPASLKVAQAGLQVLDNANADAGTLVETNRDPSVSTTTPAVGDRLVARIFAEKPTTIKGTCTDGGETITYDVSLAAGWNVLVVEVTAVAGGSATAGKAYAGGLPGDVKLYYVAPSQVDRFGSWLR
jgi:hypothetical protein